MRKPMHFAWQLGRPYFYAPWHNGLPTFRDWLKLSFGLLVLAVAFKQYTLSANTMAGESDSAPLRPRL
jgi:hypothetical protein